MRDLFTHLFSSTKNEPQNAKGDSLQDCTQRKNSQNSMTNPRLDSLSILSRLSDLAKYAATLALLLCLGVGNVWGDDASWQNNTMSPSSYFTLGSNTSAATNAKTISGTSYTHSINMTSKSNQSSSNTNGYFIRFTLTSASNVSIVFGANGGARTIRVNTGWMYDETTNASYLANGATPEGGVKGTSSSVSNGSFGTLEVSNLAAGTYYICGSGSVSIFKIEIVNASASTKRIYMQCGSSWCNDSPKFYAHSWGSSDNDVELTLADCETDVYYADIPSGNTSVVFTRQNPASTGILWEGTNFWNKSQDITISTNNLFTCTGWSDGKGTFSGSTYSAPTYTVSFNANGGSGSMSNVSSIACDGSTTLVANAYTKSGYRFTGWKTNAAVTANGSAVAVNGIVANQAELTHITSNITLTAQWEENDCPASGTLYSITVKNTSLSSVSQNTEVALATTYATETGGTAYIGNKNSDGGKAQVSTTGSGSVFFNGNDAYIKIVLDCPLQTGDMIAFTLGTGTKEICFTTTNSRSTTYVTSSQSYTCAAAFNDVSTIYVWRNDGGTYLHSLTITRPLVCGATAPGTISKSFSACTLTLTADGSPASNNTWYWQTAADGTATNLGTGATKTVTEAGTYYIRSYYSTGSCWSDAQSITVSASDLIPAAPTAFAAGSTTAKGTTFTITDAPNTNNYEIVCKTASGEPAANATPTYTSTSKTKAVTDLYAGQTYYAWVRSKCSESNKSAWTALTGNTFTTSTVSAAYHLTNVTKTSGATSGIGGSTFTAVFAANSGFSMPTPVVTIGGNAATSGTDYTWSDGTLTIAKEKITGNIDITLNSVPSAPSSATISGTYHYFPGDNISLTVTPSGNNGPTTYQWYKGGKENGNAIEGATSATYTKNSCTFDDAGSYYCKVTCNATSIWAVTNSHENYDVKILRLYVKGSKGGQDYGNVDFVKVNSTTATASISLGSNWTYGFNIADGCGHYYGNSGTMQYNSYGPWVTNQNGVDCGLTTTNAATYVFTINYSDLEMIETTVTFPSGNQESGKVIYFDNNDLQWENVYYRVGRSDHVQSAAMTKVYGTENLYHYTTPTYNNFAGWHITNAAGTTGSYSVYNTKNGTAITEATAFEGAAVTQAAVTVTPTASHATGATDENNNCEFYTYGITTGMKTQNVSITAPTNGTLTVNYVDVNNVGQAFSSGSQNLAHTCIITVTAVPNTGYAEPAQVSINGSPYGNRDPYTVTGTTVVAATFSLIDYTVTLHTNGGTINAGNVTSYNYGTGATLPTNVTKDGYTFDGWFDNSGLTGDAVTSIPSSATGNKEFWAKWTIKTTTITIDANTANHGSTTPGTVTATWGSALPSFTAAAPAIPNGYQLKGYYTGATGGTKIINANGTLVASTDYADGSGNWKYETSTLTLYAQYEPKTFTISYLDDDASTPISASPTSYTYGVGVNPLPTPSKTGYTFTGWYNEWCVKEDEEGDQTPHGWGYVNKCKTASISTTDYGDATYIASWTIEQYDVTATLNHTTKASGTTGANAATYNTEYSATFTADAGYVLPSDVTVTIGGVAQTKGTGYTWSVAAGVGTFTVPAAKVTGDIAVTITSTADCPGAGSGQTIYKFVVKNGLSAGNICSAQNTPVSLTYPEKLSTLIGGTLDGVVTNTSYNNLQYTATGSIQYANGGNGVLVLTLNCALATGDIIRYVNYSSSSSKYNYLRHTSSSTSTNQITLNASQTAGTVQQVVVPVAFNGKSVLYIVSGSNTTAISSVEIIRPYVVTLDANTNGGKVNGNNTETIYAGQAESHLLPHAFKSGNYFNGWFPNASTGDAVANPYTPTATTTLYAQFDDCPSSGTLYKFAVRTDLTTENFAETGTFDINIGNYLTDLRGGTLQGYEGSGNHYISKEATNGIKISNNAGYLKVDLDCALAEGDKFKTTVGSKTIYVNKTSLQSKVAELPVGSLQETEVPAALVGEKTLYIWRGSGTATISYFEIIRPAGYTVTYANGGATSGSVPVDGTRYEAGTTVTVLGNTGSLAKDGCTFGGWSDGVNTYSAGNTFSMPSNNVTLTAVWTPNEYDITYHLNGASWASAAGVATYTYGTGATLPVAGDLSNVGYTFNGWYANSDLSTGGVKTEVGTSEYGNKEFWAKWTEITYDVTYNANGGSGTTESQNGHYVTLRDNGFTAPSGKTFVEWNTAVDGSGASYHEGEDVELTANLVLYAIWANDYTITWGNVQLGGAGATVTPNLGGGNYTITASVYAWTGTLTTDMISAVTDGVAITNVTVDNSSSPKTITATFSVGASVAGESITLELDVPAAGIYGAKSSTEEIDIDRCTGSSGGSDGVLFSAEFKDSGLGTSNICDAANTPVTFTTDQLKAAAVGGSIKAYTTSNLSHMKYATKAISIAGSDGVIQIDLSNAIATNDLFTYVNVNSSSSSAYLRHTSADNTTDQIALTVYNSKEVKVRLTSGFNGKTTLYIVRNNSDFNLHKAAVVRPAFLMLLRDDTPTSDTNLSGSDVEITTSTYLSTINGGRIYYTSPSSGNLKIKRSNSKNYIQFNSQAGYVKVVLNEALQEGDVIGFDSYNTNELAFTTTATRSTTIRSTGLLYTVNASSALKGQTTFYIWQYSGSSDYLRGLQIARSGVAGGGGGSDQIAPTLTWSPAVSSDADWDSGNSRLNKVTGDVDFTFVVTQDKNSLGTITYASSNTSVATVNATSGKVHVVGPGDATITATIAESGCYEEATATYNIHVEDNCEDVAGTISTENLGCSGIRMTVTGQTTSGETVSYQWYKVGSPDSQVGTNSATYTAIAAGEYYVIVTNTGDNHCSKASTNTVVIEAQAAATATKIIDEWYVKNGRRTPDIALIQTENATGFIVKSGSTTIWNSDGSVTSGFAGCSFYLGEDGIIYLKGQQDDETVPAGLSAGDETLKFTASACGGNSSELSITIHKQAATSYKTVAFVVEGTKGGEWNVVTSGQADGSALYEYLDSVGTAASARKFALTECNIYKTNDEKTLRQYYSQFDAILITDNPNTKTVPKGVSGDNAYKTKGYVNAIGALIDIRPILTMEAYVSALANWSCVKGNPSSPNPRQYEMKLQCKDHEIYSGLPTPAAGTNVWEETIDGEVYRHVIMVDSTKSPYTGVAYNAETSDKPALQGFASEAMGDLLGLGLIKNDELHAGVERQEEPAARMMILGIQNKALPNALTAEGKKVIENALTYLLKTNMEEVDDCSNFFKGGDPTNPRDWNTVSNWAKSTLPNYETRVRILAPCEVSGISVKVAQIDIATSGKSSKQPNNEGVCNGSLTIAADGALNVTGKIHSAVAPYFNKNDLKPTEVNDLSILANSSGNGTLIFDNSNGDTKAWVQMYSKAAYDPNGVTTTWQYIGIPYSDISDAQSNYYDSWLYSWDPTAGWLAVPNRGSVSPWTGYCITHPESGHTYNMEGTLAATGTIEIDVPANSFQVVGNSWTAPIQIANFENEDFGDMTKSVYFFNTGLDENGTGSVNEQPTGATRWAAGTYVSVPIHSAPYTDDAVINSMQGFYVSNSGSAATLVLDYDKIVRPTSGQTITQGQMHAPKRNAHISNEPIVAKLWVSGSRYDDRLVVLEREDFTRSNDDGWDGEKWDGSTIAPCIWSVNDDGGVEAVTATPDMEGTLIGFRAGEDSEYTFHFEFDGMEDELYLLDTDTKIYTRVLTGNTYTFTCADKGEYNRFLLTRNAPSVATGVDNTHSETEKAVKFIYQDKMYIFIRGVLYDAAGKRVTERRAE